MKYSTGYQKFQIPAVRNCCATLQDTEHNKMAKENHPKTVITLKLPIPSYFGKDSPNLGVVFIVFFGGGGNTK